jgi:hypothetical protein
VSDPSILDALKRHTAMGRQEFGRALSGVTGIVLTDEDFERARAEAAERYHPEDSERFIVAHSVWLDVITANGKTRLWRQSSLARALLEQGFPIPESKPAEG